MLESPETNQADLTFSLILLTRTNCASADPDATLKARSARRSCSILKTKGVETNEDADTRDGNLSNQDIDSTSSTSWM